MEYKSRIEDSLDQIIKYIRYTEKEYRKGKSDISGEQLARSLFDQGIIKLNIYIHIVQLIDDLDLPYTINVTE